MHNGMLLLLLPLSRFSRVRLCATPEMAAPFSFLWAPLAFGMIFGPPSETMYLKIYEMEANIVENESVSRSDVSDSLRPHGL